MKFLDLNLNKPLLNALTDLGFEHPTNIQQKAFSVVMSGKDVIGIAQTGTGKTLAYLLPLLRILPFSNQRDPRIVILVPTRELVVQVVEEIEKLTEYMSVRVAGVYGGTNINTQAQKVLEGLDILVGTPGRLFDLAANGSLKLKSVNKLVIDEVDEMMDLGFKHQIKNIIDILPERRQNLMFSATLNKEVEQLLNDEFFEPVKLEAAPHGTPLEQIEQYNYHAPNFLSKLSLFKHLIDNDPEMTKVLVFCESKKFADKLASELEESHEDKFGVIHSNKSQNQRFAALKGFTEGDFQLLIATDLVARGLDISEVTHVLNFDTPGDPSNYIHRIGRTGRADKKGIAITFTAEKELTNLQNIEGLMKLQLTLLETPEEVEYTEEVLEIEKTVVHGATFVSKPKKVSDNGAFHEKKEKNKKVNLGGSYRREIKKKYKKPKKRRPKK